MVNIAKLWKSKFPKTCEFIEEGLPRLPLSHEKVWNAFLVHSWMGEAKARIALQPGQSLPSLWFKELGGFDGIFRYTNPNLIEINSLVATKFEDAYSQADAQQFLIAKVLHEMVHWARYPREPSDAEAGVAFENDAFGKVVPRFWDTQTTGKAHVVLEPAAADERAPSEPGNNGFQNADMAPGMPRGIRNNNPGNIKRADGIQWKGLADEDDMNIVQKRETTFCVFSEPKWGLRALARVLRNYQRLHNLRTTLQMISRWAPPSDNNLTQTYAEAVANYLNIDVNEPIDFEANADLAVRMMHAIIRQENGTQPYTTAQLHEGYRLSA
ncbi:hypothetical protein [Pelagibius marinus]|uniref:hypothetical protein n=1 Tax=Pelagibius marinus TaxID=2762760 RepID=UPI0018723423|nr:hypothetical protein [Pelagibius marinus]